MEKINMIYKYGVELNNRKHPILVEEEQYEYDAKNIKSPNLIVEMMNDVFHLSSKAEEYGYMVAFTSAFEVLGVFEISHGSINFSLLSPREIMIRALLSGANGVVVLHNHPSGSLDPSKDDMKTFKQIKEAFNILNIDFHDFIIVGDGFYSFKKENVF